MNFKKVSKISFAIIFLCVQSLAQASKMDVTCTTNTRFYCSGNGECEVNKDVNPSVYKLQGVGDKAVDITKYIGREKISSWTIKVHNSNLSNKYQFIDGGIAAIFSMTNDKKKFTYIYDSGVAAYNSDVLLKKTPTSVLGGQIEVGSCIAN